MLSDTLVVCVNRDPVLGGDVKCGLNICNAETVAKVLGVSPSSGYELMHEPDFPALRIGSRIVIPKEAFIRWVEEHTGGTA